MPGNIEAIASGATGSLEVTLPIVAQPESSAVSGVGGDKGGLEQGYGDLKGEEIARGVLE